MFWFDIIFFIIVVLIVVFYGLKNKNIPVEKRTPEFIEAALLCAIFCYFMDYVISLSYLYAFSLWFVIFAIVFTVNKYRSEKLNTKFSFMLALWATAGILIFAFCLLLVFYAFMAFLKLMPSDGAFLANILLSSTFSLAVNLAAIVIYWLCVMCKKIIKKIKR